MHRPARVAVVHDWLTGMRGGERVLEAILEEYPDAVLHTLVHVPGRMSERIRQHRIVTSFIDSLPFAHQRHQLYLPLFPAAVGSFDLSDFDLVISSSHCVAKGAITRPGTPHICYCHTPMRYAWDFKDLYFRRLRASGLRIAVDSLLEMLRIWDVTTAPRVDGWIANSRHVAARIRRYYGRESHVVPPPVDVDHFRPVEKPARDYYLVLSALVPYKRLDLVIEAAPRLPYPVKVIGAGPERKSLERAARGRVEFLGERDRAEVSELLANARALLFPGEEDFGITPLEAHASGVPVIAYDRGGARETVVAGRTGVFFPAQTVESLVLAILEAETLRWDPAVLRARALEFGPDRFRERFRAAVCALLPETGTLA